MIEGMPPQKRSMSQFMAKELLYDYINENLDPARKEAVEKALTEYPELAKELELISFANDYCEKLSKTKVNDELIQSLGQIKSISKAVASRFSWQQWPDALRWATEAVALSSMVIAFTVVAPWDDIRVWMENFNQTSTEISEPIVEKEIAKTESQVVDATDVEKKIDDAKVVKVARQVEETKPETKPTLTPLAGTLYRMNMQLEGIEGRAVEVRDKIVALGGKKAGRVRLGLA